MDKLKAVIREYGRWSVLEVFIDRIEAIEENAVFNTLLRLGVFPSSTELLVQISLPTDSNKAFAL
jgi:hypothetical protein